jgi:hypothetical protein
MTDVHSCPPDHKHGATGTCYGEHLCRCDECRGSHAIRSRDLTRRKAYGTFDSGLVDAEPVRQHIEMLRGFGMGARRIGTVSGLGRSVIEYIIWGRAVTSARRHRPAIPAKRVSREYAAKILALKPEIAALDDNAVIPSRGTQRRIQALVARGWSMVQLANQAGLHRRTIGLITRQPTVHAGTHRRIAALYEALWDTEPDRETAVDKHSYTLSINLAAARRWLPPLAWDDIDNDTEPPATEHDTTLDEIAVELACMGEKVRLNSAERRAVIQILHPRKWSDNLVAAHADCDERTVLRIRQELGLEAWDQTELTKRAA